MKYKIILFLGMVTLLTLGFGLTYSFFYSSNGSSIDQKIAGLILNAENKEEMELVLSDLGPGDTKEFEFSVGNTSDTDISDVTVEYELVIKTYHLTPVTIELYKVEDEEEKILFCDETFERNESNELLCTTSVQELKHSSEELDNYKLKVTFDENYNDVIYSNLIDYIDVEIKSWQKS